MCLATLDLISPNGVPVTLHVTDADDQQTILATIDRAETIRFNHVCTISARHLDGEGCNSVWGQDAGVCPHRGMHPMANAPLTSGTE